MSERPRAQYSFETEKEPFAESSAKLYKSKITIELEGKERQIDVVIKEFSLEENAEFALEYHQSLKKMGVAILPGTYRAVPGHRNQIAMTDFTKGGRRAISSNQRSGFEKGGLISLDLQKLEKELKRIGVALCKLTDNRVAVPDDAYFAIVPENGGEDIDLAVVLADLDYIQFDSPRESQELFLENVGVVRQFIEDNIVSRLTDSSNKDEAEQMIGRWTRGLRKSYFAELAQKETDD